MQEELKAALAEEKSVAVAFSGGLDSSVLAKMCRDLNRSVILLTVGFAGSHDMIFSESIASQLLLPHKKHNIQQDEFYENLNRVKRTINCRIASHLENCTAYLFVARLAKENGFDMVLTANGIDELFCGYNQYRFVYKYGKSGIMKLMHEKILNELLLMEEITKVTSDYGVTIKKPFLSERFIGFANTIPIDEKIKSEDDLLRKHVIRRLALDMGVPEEAAMKSKKALQYGSLIHKYFTKRNHHNRMSLSF
ncbi:MAG: asparagine synthase C-terminal domain-containing protein [Nitrososphaeraceae archaeon]|jgi:asparagine synthase (glutamine-hydrolysing)